MQISKQLIMDHQNEECMGDLVPGGIWGQVQGVGSWGHWSGPRLERMAHPRKARLTSWNKDKTLEMNRAKTVRSFS